MIKGPALVGALVLSAFAWINNFADSQTHPADFRKDLKGRFVLEKAQCAGFEFINEREIIWRNEITCASPDTFLVHWVDAKSFLVKDKKQAGNRKDCAPRVWHYTVQAYDGNQLQLNELWTGWGNYKNETLKFSRLAKK